MSQDREPSRQWPDEAVLTGAAALDTHLADLVVYCRTVAGRDEDAVSAAHAVLDSAQSLLTDPDKLRAWLFALARVEILADSQPDAREMLDLVHRHGIRPEDLPVVVGIPPVEADQMLAAAEAEYDDVKHWDHRPGWDESTHLIERQPDLTAVGSPGEMLDAQLPNLVAYCSALAGGEEEAIGTAHSVLDSSRSLLTDPDRLRAWLFALARQEMVADAAPDAQEIFDLVHRHQIRAENLPAILGIPQAEAAKLLATGEKEYFRGVLGAGQHETDSRESEDWQEDVGPKSHRLQDLYGLFSGGGLRQVLARGPAQAAAATAIVVAVIGGGAAYLAASSLGGRPSQAVPVTGHLPGPAPQTPVRTPSPTPTASPSHSPAPSKSITVVRQPPPAQTSTKPSPTHSTTPPPTTPPPTSPPPTSPPPTSPPPTSPPPTNPPPTTPPVSTSP